jgi:uncharacterized membrane protein YdbT with pleckstrin-like domain
MAYPRRLLGDNETLVFELRPHWWYFAAEMFSGVGVLALLVGVFQVNGDARSVGLWLFAALATAWALWVLVTLLRWVNTHFVCTDQRLIFRSGVLSREGREIPLHRVNDISFRQSLWHRVIRAGDLVIESAGEQGQQRFTDIPHPESVQQEIWRQVMARDQRE